MGKTPMALYWCRQAPRNAWSYFTRKTITWCRKRSQIYQHYRWIYPRSLEETKHPQTSTKTIKILTFFVGSLFLCQNTFCLEINEPRILLQKKKKKKPRVFLKKKKKKKKKK